MRSSSSSYWGAALADLTDVAAAHSTLASILDSAGSIANRATDYPVAVQAIFAITLVLVLGSILVYAFLFPTATPDGESPG